MYRGYFKCWRKFQDNPRFSNPEYLALWIWVLMLSTHKEKESMFNGKKIIVNPGQFVTGRKFLSSISGISESKIQRLLKCFENEQQIEQQTSSTSRLITIINWKQYQQDEQQFEQQMNNKRTTNEQRMNTNKNDNNDKNDKNDIYITLFEELWNDYPRKDGKAGSHKKFIKLIKDNNIEDIRNAVNNYAIACKPKEKRFIKKFYNWVESGDWKDYIVLSNEKKKEVIIESGKMTSNQIDYLEKREKFLNGESNTTKFIEG